MFNWFKKDKKEQAIVQAIDEYKKDEKQRFEDYLRAKEDEKHKVEEAEAQRVQELEEVARRIDKEKEDAIKNSDNPWVKVESAGVDNNGNIAVKLDWNLAFIDYLRRTCNFQGDEDIIVQQWLAALYKEMVSGMKNNALNIFSEKMLGEDLIDKTKNDISGLINQDKE